MPDAFAARCAEMLRRLDLFRAELVGYLADGAHIERSAEDDERPSEPRKSGSWWPEAIVAALTAAGGPLTSPAVDDAVHALDYPGLEDLAVRRKRASTYLGRQKGKTVRQVDGCWDLIDRPVPQAASEAAAVVDDLPLGSSKPDSIAPYHVTKLRSILEEKAKVDELPAEEREALAAAAAAAARAKEEADLRQAAKVENDRIRARLGQLWDTLATQRRKKQDCTETLGSIAATRHPFVVPAGPRLVASFDVPAQITFEDDADRPDCAIGSDPGAQTAEGFIPMDHDDLIRDFPFFYTEVGGYDASSRDDKVRLARYFKGDPTAQFPPRWTPAERERYVKEHEQALAEANA
ncbi:hypothetical protein EP7_004055 [Isosphaeraceae bacterium EP7]